MGYIFFQKWSGCARNVHPRATPGQTQSGASGEMGRCSGRGKHRVHSQNPAEGRGRLRREAPPRIAPPPRSRVSALAPHPALNPGTPGEPEVYGCVSSARTGYHLPATESPKLSGSRDTLSCWHPQTPLQPRPKPGHPRPESVGALRGGAHSTSAPCSGSRTREREPPVEFWALRPARGAGWRARRCWPLLCGSAWRPGLPLWVRSPLPRRKAERSGTGGEIGVRRGPGGRT